VFDEDFFKPVPQIKFDAAVVIFYDVEVDILDLGRLKADVFQFSQ